MIGFLIGLLVGSISSLIIMSLMFAAREDEHDDRNDDRCVVCGAVIPEGRQVCPECETDREQNHVKNIFNMLNEPEKYYEGQPYIKDSGNRRKFETGAVRDIQEGKGRCDLLPLDIIAYLMNDEILNELGEFQKSGGLMYLYNAINLFCKIRYDGSDSNMWLEISKHFEQGAKKYGDNNWKKGIPVHCYLDSATRHYLKWRRGDKDEPHDRAFVWNCLCCIWTIKNKPEMYDAE